jgi:hypothetical protein
MVMVLPVDWMEPVRRLLAGPLARLRVSLDGLAKWLRDNIASAAGEGVSAILRALLGQSQSQPRPYTDPYRQERYDTWNRYGDREWPDEEPLDECAEAVPRAAPAPPPVKKAWRLETLLVTVQAACWWLRRQPGKAPGLTALSIGLVTAVAACAGAPLIAALAALIGSALGLVALADAARTSATALAEAVEP